MDRIKDVLKFLAAPLEWVADIIRKFPKGTLIVWLLSLAVAAWLF